jgi:hypothetical protein
MRVSNSSLLYKRYTVPGRTRPVLPARCTAEALEIHDPVVCHPSQIRIMRRIRIRL